MYAAVDSRFPPPVRLGRATLGLSIVLALAAVSAPAQPPGFPAALYTAESLRLSSIHGAWDGFWQKIAVCLNHEFSELATCILDAEAEVQDELQLIEDQYAARLALIPVFGNAAYDPDLDEEDFEPHITNPLFPLPVGRRLLYHKQTSEGLETIEVQVLPGMKEVDDVPCRIVRDTVRLNGELVEDTHDYYSQHEDGAVWYLGEVARNYDEDGFLDNLDGSWRAGVEGAEPGILMLDTPTVEASYRQEFFPGEAEDWATVLALDETVVVPAGTFLHCVKTEEGSPLEPGHVGHKWYAPGVGLVKEFSPASGEVTQLVQIQN